MEAQSVEWFQVVNVAHMGVIRALLTRLEWEGDSHAFICPCCRESKAHGHEAGCELARMLEGK